MNYEHDWAYAGVSHEDTGHAPWVLFMAAVGVCLLADKARALITRSHR